MRWQVSLSMVFGFAAALAACDDSAFEPRPDQIKKPAPAASPSGATVQAAVKVTFDASDLAFFKPLPERFDSDKNPITEPKVKLGRMLYYENRMSLNQELSCNSCHLLDKYGVDNEATSIGHKKQRGGRNSPTVYNAAGHVAQFWDGRAATIEDQAKGPILNPIEMAMANSGEVLKVIKSIPQYEKLFKEVNGKTVGYGAKCHHCKSILSGYSSSGTGHLSIF